MINFNIGNIDDKIDELQTKINTIFRRRGSEDQDLTWEGIKATFKEIDQEPPEILRDAHTLINIFPISPTNRADILTEMLAVSERVSVLYSQWNRTIDQLEEVFYPPKDSPTGEKLSEKQRDVALSARMAPYKAIQDILFYLMVHTAKIAPSTHQSILNLERQLLGKE